MTIKKQVATSGNKKAGTDPFARFWDRRMRLLHATATTGRRNRA